MSEMQCAAAEPQMLAVLLRVLGGEPGALHLWFEAAVLDRYREPVRSAEGFQVMRTNSVGRVRAPGNVWSLDFGIAPDETAIHSTVADLSQRLPAGERTHWATHALIAPSSRNYLTMRLSPGACIDDGDLRSWEPNG